jgi:hypothetical protein
MSLYCIREISWIQSVLSHSNLVHSLTPYFSNTHSNTIFQWRKSSPKWPLSLKFSDQISVWMSSSAFYVSRPSVSFDLISQLIRYKIQIMKFTKFKRKRTHECLYLSSSKQDYFRMMTQVKGWVTIF